MMTDLDRLTGSLPDVHERRTTDVRGRSATLSRGSVLERRNAASRTALVRRVLVEFEEMPGMQLTQAQANRLFGLRNDICTRVLTTLVNLARLRRDSNGAYVLAGDRP